MRAGLGTAVLNTDRPAAGRDSLDAPESAGGKSTLTSVQYPPSGPPARRCAPISEPASGAAEIGPLVARHAGRAGLAAAIREGPRPAKRDPGTGSRDDR